MKWVVLTFVVAMLVFGQDTRDRISDYSPGTFNVSETALEAAGGSYEHDWSPCAWIVWDNHWEVPEYYPPNRYIRVEVCKRCGLIRVPPEDLKQVVEEGR